jgi:hypothetical protein
MTQISTATAGHTMALWQPVCAQQICEICAICGCAVAVAVAIAVAPAATVGPATRFRLCAKKSAQSAQSADALLPLLLLLPPRPPSRLRPTSAYAPKNLFNL